MVLQVLADLFQGFQTAFHPPSDEDAVALAGPDEEKHDPLMINATDSEDSMDEWIDFDPPKDGVLFQAPKDEWDLLLDKLLADDYVPDIVNSPDPIPYVDPARSSTMMENDHDLMTFTPGREQGPTMIGAADLDDSIDEWDLLLDELLADDYVPDTPINNSSTKIVNSPDPVAYIDSMRKEASLYFFRGSSSTMMEEDRDLMTFIPAAQAATRPSSLRTNQYTTNNEKAKKSPHKVGTRTTPRRRTFVPAARSSLAPPLRRNCTIQTSLLCTPPPLSGTTPTADEERQRINVLAKLIRDFHINTEVAAMPQESPHFVRPVALNQRSWIVPPPPPSVRLSAAASTETSSDMVRKETKLRNDKPSSEGEATVHSGTKHGKKVAFAETTPGTTLFHFGQTPATTTSAPSSAPPVSTTPFTFGSSSNTTATPSMTWAPLFGANNSSTTTTNSMFSLLPPASSDALTSLSLPPPAPSNFVFGGASSSPSMTSTATPSNLSGGFAFAASNTATLSVPPVTTTATTTPGTFRGFGSFPSATPAASPLFGQVGGNTSAFELDTMETSWNNGFAAPAPFSPTSEFPTPAFGAPAPAKPPATPNVGGFGQPQTTAPSSTFGFNAQPPAFGAPPPPQFGGAFAPGGFANAPQQGQKGGFHLGSGAQQGQGGLCMGWGGGSAKRRILKARRPVTTTATTTSGTFRGFGSFPSATPAASPIAQQGQEGGLCMGWGGGSAKRRILKARRPVTTSATTTSGTFRGFGSFPSATPAAPPLFGQVGGNTSAFGMDTMETSWNNGFAAPVPFAPPLVDALPPPTPPAMLLVAPPLPVDALPPPTPPAILHVASPLPVDALPPPTPPAVLHVAPLLPVDAPHHSPVASPIAGAVPVAPHQNAPLEAIGIGAAGNLDANADFVVKLKAWLSDLSSSLKDSQLHEVPGDDPKLSKKLITELHNKLVEKCVPTFVSHSMSESTMNKSLSQRFWNAMNEEFPTKQEIIKITMISLRNKRSNTRRFAGKR